MTIALYPATIYPLAQGYSIEPIFSTQRTPMKSGADVAEKMWNYPRYRIRLPYRVSSADTMTLLNFFDARCGGYEAFDFQDFIYRAWQNVYITTATGATLGLIECDISPTTVYVDGVELAATGAWSTSLSPGTNGRTQINLTTPPSAGEVITADSTNTKRFFRVRFEDDAIRASSTMTYSGSAPYHDFDVTLISQR